MESNIEGITVEELKKLGVNTILMSPPCQPFTRNGLHKDINDKRTASFIHLLELLPDLDIENILVENVKGFEKSQMRNMLLKVLINNNFNYQEFILSPNQFGIPNSRTRYYCLAKRKSNTFSFHCDNLVNGTYFISWKCSSLFNFQLEYLPSYTCNEECHPISEILELDVDKKYFLSDTILKKRFNIIDICSKDSTRSCCFTKAYGRYFEGTGSILSERTENEVQEVYNKIKNIDNRSEDYLEKLKMLQLRFFTPKEICRLMCFPETFSFPNSVADNKKYAVLGNSVNVKVVANLIKYLDSWLIGCLYSFLCRFYWTFFEHL